MPAQSNAQVRLRRKTIRIETETHKGAWKVAYADFVTAMMAFFMLMWLLGATTEKQRKGIADYFNPTIPVVRASGGGSGAFGGDSVFSEDGLTQSGTGAGRAPTSNTAFTAGAIGSQTEAASDPKLTAMDPTAEFGDLQQALQGLGGESMMTELLARHIVTKLSDEGLVIEIFDTPGSPLFDLSERPTALLEDILKVLVPYLARTSNALAVYGHTSAVPVVRRVNEGWTHSTHRADAVRSRLQTEGLEAARFARVTGFADRKPIVANTMAVRNDRIEIVLLRSRL